MSDQIPSLPAALLAGGVTGTIVDSTLHPIDTIKTRLQSPGGLWKAGGFRGSFAGILPVLLVTAPNSAIFFGCYETAKALGDAHLPAKYEPWIMMSGATAGEVTSLLIRVPAEVVKQRAQASRIPSLSILRDILKQDGYRGLYRGFASTVLRDAPYAFVQYPLWELCKRIWARQQGYPVTVWQSSICGAIAGGIAGIITTPCDVVKTRVMLGGQGSKGHIDRIPDIFRTLLKEKGVRGLFYGVVPRFIWMSVGGAYFLGLYELFKIEFMQYKGWKNNNQS